MAFSVAQGKFTSRTTAGTQEINISPSFEPKIVLFYTGKQAADGVSATAWQQIGVATSSTVFRNIGAVEVDAQDTTDSLKWSQTNAAVSIINTSATTLFAADLVSMDADGFTIEVIVALNPGIDIYYLALGGTDLTNVAVGNATSPTSIGDSSTTGVGFQPDALILLGSTVSTGTTGTTASATMCVGMATSGGQGVSAVRSRDAQATSTTYSYQRTDKCFAIINTASADLLLQASYVSMDADGYTLNWDTVQATGRYYYYIALKGGSYDVGAITSQTGTGNFSDTSLAFTPSAGIFLSNCKGATTTVDAGWQMSLGAATSTSARGVISTFSEDAQGVSDADTVQDTTALYSNYDYNQTLEGDIDFVSWNADGFTLNQTDADPTGNEIIYLVMGAAGAAAVAAKLQHLTLLGVG